MQDVQDASRPSRSRSRSPLRQDARRPARRRPTEDGADSQPRTLPSCLANRRTGKTAQHLAETEKPPQPPAGLPAGGVGSALATCASCRFLRGTPLIELGLEPFGQTPRLLDDVGKALN